MCLELVGRAVDDENYLRRLKLPEAFWPLISESWHRDDGSLYGRLDLSFGAHGPAKLLEYNADTPTALLESAVIQWFWFKDLLASLGGLERGNFDQFNSIHERLIRRWEDLKQTGIDALHLCSMDTEEDLGTLRYVGDCAAQAGQAPP